MRHLTKMLITLTLVCQLTGARATSSEANEILSTIIKKDTTPLFRNMYLAKKKDKALAQSEKNTISLVTALLLQKLDIQSILRNQSILMLQRLLIHANCESDCKPMRRMSYFAPLLSPQRVLL